MRGKCERGRGKCERGRGSANADGAGAKAFAGDGCSQGASFGPMAAISRRGQGGRIYNNTRARVLLRRMCVKPAALTTHSPPKTSARPRTATRPPRVLLLPHAAPTHARRLRDAFPAAPQHLPRRRLSLAPAQRHARPEHFRSPTQRRCTPTQSRRTPAGCAMHARRPHHPFPPKTSAPPRSADARPQAARCIPRQPHNPFPAEDLRSPPHSDTPFPSTSAPPRSTDARPQAARCTPADLTTPSPQRHAASPSVPLRAQKNGTAQCMCDAECLGRPSLRSVIWVGEPRAVRHRCGALACRRGA